MNKLTNILATTSDQQIKQAGIIQFLSSILNSLIIAIREYQQEKLYHQIKFLEQFAQRSLNGLEDYQSEQQKQLSQIYTKSQELKNERDKAKEENHKLQNQYSKLTNIVIEQQEKIQEYKVKERRVIILLSHLQDHGVELKQISRQLFMGNGNLRDNDNYDDVVNQQALSALILTDSKISNFKKKIENIKFNIKLKNSCNQNQNCKQSDADISSNFNQYFYLLFIIDISSESSFEFLGKSQDISFYNDIFPDKVPKLTTLPTQCSSNLKIDLSKIKNNIMANK